MLPVTMKGLGCVVLLALFAITVKSSSDIKHHIVHEESEFHKHGLWVRTSRLDPEGDIPLRIALTQSNIDKGHDLLMEISDPKHARYGQHYHIEEVVGMFAPAPKTIKAVLAWLAGSGISNKKVVFSDDHQFLKLNTTVQKLESLLHTSYHIYKNVNSNEKALGCEYYKVPADVRDYIDYISPGVRLIPLPEDNMPRKRKRSSSRANSLRVQPSRIVIPHVTGKVKFKFLTPRDVQDTYGIPHKNPTVQPENSMGIFQTGLSGLNHSDLNVFLTKYYPKIPNNTFPEYVRVDGAPPNHELSTYFSESDLDVQAALPIVWPDKLAIFEVDDRYYENKGLSANKKWSIGIFNTFLDSLDKSYCTFKAFGEKGDNPNIDPIYPDPHKHGYKGKLQCGKYEPPKVISISYGEDERSLPMNYQRRQCLEFMKLGMQGISVFSASGDSGVSSGANPIGPICGSNGTGGRVFTISYPVNCPYITAVGGTDAHYFRKAWPGSGGGFSNIYPRPKYQDAAIDVYFNKHAPPYKYYNTTYNKDISPNGGLYNRAGRGLPDVAALGAGYVGVCGSNGFGCAWAGTSLSTPLFASVITRINNARLAAGKSTVGFVNQVLYANPDMFFDATRGNNPGCGTKGFYCVPGWDPATGLGSPIYPKMHEVFLNLP